jgi:hypothetical protein
MRNTALLLALVGGLTFATALEAHADDAPLYTCKQATGQISVSFAPQTSLKDLVTWVVGFSCKNVVFDADVEARVPRVTIVAPKPMSAKQALQLFVDAIEATGLEVVQKKDTMIIKLGRDMPKTCVASSSVGTSGTITGAPIQSPPVDDAAAAELEKVLQSGIKKVDDTHYDPPPLSTPC